MMELFRLQYLAEHQYIVIHGLARDHLHLPVKILAGWNRVIIILPSQMQNPVLLTSDQLLLPNQLKLLLLPTLLMMLRVMVEMMVPYLSQLPEGFFRLVIPGQVRDITVIILKISA